MVRFHAISNHLGCNIPLGLQLDHVLKNPVTLSDGSEVENGKYCELYDCTSHPSNIRKLDTYRVVLLIHLNDLE